MNKLNVCLLNDSFPPSIDGVANTVTNYAKIISGQLGNATVVTPYYPEADDSIFSFPVLRYPSLDTTKIVGYRAGIPLDADLLSQMEAQDFDIIHSHCPASSTLFARELRDRINAPVVLTYHTKFDIDIANAIRGKLLREEAARFLAHNIAACDEVWAVSRGAGENLRKLGYEGEYVVMANGVDIPRGRVDDALIAEATAGYDLPAGVPVFLFVGRMMWYKGIRITLGALARLKSTGQDFRMVFVGAGGDKDEIVAYCADLGLNDKVVFTPAIHDRDMIRAWYCRADLFLFPSTYDTNGLVVREAAACGLGSVLVAGSCAAEDVTDGETGFLIEENAASMAAVLTALCGNIRETRRVGEQAQRDIYISWEDAVRMAYERYGVVIENYRRGLCPRHERIADDFIHGFAAAMDAVNQSRERRHHIEREFFSKYEGLKAGISDEKQRVKARLDELSQKTGWL